ncbi:MAG: ABC transporter ATP-binding protein [Candidatus Nomurabacteria bacterium]|nr:MAG: ABC transporter ATP-binding protein [Candidatus Nomurabacteria bacterium]
MDSNGGGADQHASLEHQVKAPILEATGASRIYKVGGNLVTTVSDVSLQVGFGDFAVIFGPSGAGKSTLLNILMGLEKPDVGEVFLKGESLYGYSEEDRTILRSKRISYLPQTQYWIEFMDVTDNVALPLILQGMSQRKARVKAREWLEKVGLKEEMGLNPDELSSGQQQKAALARALIKDPWLIFADEPTAHLDSKSVEEVTDLLLSSTKEHGVTIVMVTHDLSFLKLSKKWFFMRDGRLWDIRDKRNPFNNIRDVLAYVDSGKADQEGAS